MARDGATIDAARKQELDQAARAILATNDRGGFTVPTAGLYPFQWNWDSCLVALGWAAIDEARAWQEIESLFAAQWPDGMVPHIVFHSADAGYFPGPEVWGTGRAPESSGITQPPVAASCVARLWRGATDRHAARPRTVALLHRLADWHAWWRRARDPHGRDLVAILHPWESGMDNSPAWDAALARVAVDPDLPAYQRRDTGHVDAAQRPTTAEYDRYLTLVRLFRANGWDSAVLHDLSPFRVCDVATNAILLAAEHDLAALAGDLGEPGRRAEAEARAADLSSGLESLWNAEAGLYRAHDRIAGARVSADTSAGFFPLLDPSLPEPRRAALVAGLERWLDAAPIGLATVHPDDPSFDRRRYWRGPTWAIVNFLLSRGLETAGRPETAERLRAATARAIAGAGFFEYFDPLDGTGLGGRDFSWTAAMWLAWVSPGEEG
ncbi:MAG: trehalase family glycosidase [Azospirillaceae bacterium]